MRRWLFLLPMFLLTACQAQVMVDIDAESDGSGEVAVEVRLDQEASAALPDIESKLRTEDLARSGWTVHPVQRDDGHTVLRISQGYEGEAQANFLLTQLSAGGGPFEEFRINQNVGLTEVGTSFSGRVNLTRGIESFGDPTLQQRTGSPFGFDLREMGVATAVDWERSVPVTVRFSAPGEVTSQVPPAVEGAWPVPYGQVTTLSAAYSGTNWRALTFALLGMVALVGALVILFVTRSGRYKPKHQRKDKSGPSARQLMSAG